MTVCTQSEISEALSFSGDNNLILELVQQIGQPTIVILIFMTILSWLFNLKELHKRLMEQRRTHQPLSFTTAVRKLYFQCSVVASPWEEWKELVRLVKS